MCKTSKDMLVNTITLELVQQRPAWNCKLEKTYVFMPQVYHNLLEMIITASTTIVGFL